MWYTPFFSLFLIFFFFLLSPDECLWLFCYFSVWFLMCGFAGFYFCVTGAGLSTSQHWYCYSFCSKVSSARRHEYDWTTSHINFCIKFILIFADVGFVFPSCSFAFAVRACLAPWTVLTSDIFNSISHLHVILHTSLLPFQLWMFNIQPLWTRVGFGFLPLPL